MPATETFSYTLPSGAIIEVQNLPGGARGAREVAAEREERPPLAKGPAPLGEVVQLVLDQYPLHREDPGQSDGGTRGRAQRQVVHRPRLGGNRSDPQGDPDLGKQDPGLTFRP